MTTPVTFILIKTAGCIQQQENNQNNDRYIIINNNLYIAPKYSAVL